jgi:hypothetical protein
MNENTKARIEQMHREAVQRHTPATTLSRDLPTIHYTELPEASADSPLQREWNTYRREAARLLAQGHAGRHVLIKGEDIIGLWDTRVEAICAGYERFLGQAFLVHQVQEREPVLRNISVHSCRNTPTPFKQAS